MLRAFYVLSILAATAFTSFYVGANHGFSFGYKDGYAQSIFDSAGLTVRHNGEVER